MIKVGITGRTGSGKSTIAEGFKFKGAKILDVDQIAREIVSPGSNTLDKIVKTFGKEVLSLDGSLDRKKLAFIVFNSEEKLEALNAITRKELFLCVQAWLEQMSKEAPSVVIVDAAILIEAGMDELVDVVVCLWADDDVLIERIMKRDNLEYEQAKSRLNSQKSNEYYISNSDISVDSTTGVADKIDELWTEIINFK